MMIINSGLRTDIPAFFSEWFFNRIKEGFVLVRNPYNMEYVIKYLLNPDVVDCLAFCTKNPEPMLKRLNEISSFKQFWFVTITPYERDIEPFVPSIDSVIDSFIKLSAIVGKESVQWRYDPIIITEKYNIGYHIKVFRHIATKLENHTDTCIISFLDIYKSTKRNFPEAEEVSIQDQIELVKEFVTIGLKHGIKIKSCMEHQSLKQYGVITDGCMTKDVYESILKTDLLIPKTKSKRDGCSCILGNGIGEYSTCSHGCLYCYANSDFDIVKTKVTRHNPLSSILIGEISEKDIIKDAKQWSYKTGQKLLF